MRDLTFFNDGNNKKLKNGLYNFSKLRTMVYKVNNSLHIHKHTNEGETTLINVTHFYFSLKSSGDTRGQSTSFPLRRKFRNSVAICGACPNKSKCLPYCLCMYITVLSYVCACIKDHL